MKTPELMAQDLASIRTGRGRLKYRYLYWTWRFMLWLGPKVNRPCLWNGGRHSDGDPVVCSGCLHVCRQRDCVHAYQDDGAGDVEPVDRCPQCGSDGI